MKIVVGGALDPGREQRAIRLRLLAAAVALVAGTVAVTQHAAHAFRLVAHVDVLSGRLWPWWLDVERANSWARHGAYGRNKVNVAAIRGFVDGLRSAGVRAAVGIYSTPADWVAITGMSVATSRS